MKNPINTWRKFFVRLGYLRATILHAFVIMPLVWLGFWLLVFGIIPSAFGSSFHVSSSAIISGPLWFLWVIPSLVSGILIWPMCRLGLGDEPRFTSLSRTQNQAAEKDITPDR